MVENDDDKTGSFFVDCNSLGAQFVHVVVDDVAVADILDPIYVPDIVNSFFWMNSVLNYQGTSKPLLAMQVTELDDGIFIGCTLNNCVYQKSKKSEELSESHESKSPSCCKAEAELNDK